MEIPIQTVKTVNAPLPDKIKVKARERKTENPELRAGWWTISEKGTLTGVCDVVDKCQAPDYWKAAIKGDLQAGAAKGFNFFALDAHYYIHGGEVILQYHLSGSKVAL